MVRILVIGLLPFVFGVDQSSGSEEPLDYNRDVRPILSDACFHCHGPDAQNQSSEFRMDTEENLFADLGGYFGVVPGDLEESEIHYRIHTDDEIDAMPPPDANRLLTDEERAILDRWITEGATWEGHWAFQIAEKSEIPPDQHPVDFFIDRKLAEESITPNQRASRETLLRRASLALTGLLPTPEEVDTFLAKPDSDEIWRGELQRLMATSAYAERQTLLWLDGARYADTDGFQNDAERSNWPWRDWVIKAYQDNLPFDQFTIEQLAGDMLPEATNHQILASAYNRNHRQNSEGGALAEEFLVENVIDRVETTSTVWLGLTMGCARCHDHKYDPITQREFFQLYAYFNNIGERGTGKGVTANPILQTGSPLIDVPVERTEELETAHAALAAAKKSANARFRSWVEELPQPSKDPVWDEVEVTDAQSSSGMLLIQPDSSWIHDGPGGTRVKYTFRIRPGEGPVTALRLDALTDPKFSAPTRLSRSNNGNFVVTEFEVEANGEALAIAQATSTWEQDRFPVSQAVDGNPNSGWGVFRDEAQSVGAVFFLSETFHAKADTILTVSIHNNTHYPDHFPGRVALRTTGTAISAKDKIESREGPDLVRIAVLPEDQRNEEDRKSLRAAFDEGDLVLKTAERDLAGVERRMSADGFAEVPVMVMQEREGEVAPAYLLNRGSYLEPDMSEALPRMVPAALDQPEVQPGNRLELAQWIVSDQNPLTSRVIVNRMWQSLFGVGLVKTVEDFGLQSEYPSHPELLDWLAVEFRESGWDIRAMFELLLTSDAFQRSSVFSSDQREHDPENRFLARGPRYRLDGFAIRDVALQAAGLLDRSVGGQPVKPYQPEGLWATVSGRAGISYQTSEGGDLYRRSLYTYWKRAVNPPRQIIFDAAGREACNVSMRVTNTPLQALVLMNDVTFIEAARHLAERVIAEEKKLETNADPIAALYRLATGREITPRIHEVLSENRAWFTDHFAQNAEAANELLATGASGRDESIDPLTHAALTAVAHLVLNLDETITYE